jgi:hypothetical protein
VETLPPLASFATLLLHIDTGIRDLVQGILVHVQIHIGAEMRYPWSWQLPRSYTCWMSCQT